MTTLRQSLARRITTLVALAILLVVTLVSIAMDQLVDAELQRRFRDGLAAKAQALAAVASMEDGRLVSSRPVTLLGGGEVRFKLQCEGRPASISEPAPMQPDGWTSGDTFTSRFSAAGHHDIEAMSMAFRTPENLPCRLLVTQSRKELDAILEAIDWILLAGPAIATALVLLLVPILVRSGLAPLRVLRQRMSLIGPQSPHQRLSSTGVVELEPLMLRFNEVLARMDEGLARERRFASGLAHETRTRLAELRSLVDVERRYPSGRSLPSILAEVGTIGGELEATVTALLRLTRLEAGLERVQREPVEIAAWLHRVVARRQAAIEARNLSVEIVAGNHELYETDPALLEVLVGNLLDNAVSYSPASSTIHIRHVASELEVTNASEDLVASDIAQFGLRFWRKRSHEAGHAGLGLALAQAAAAQLGLQLTFQLDDALRVHARVNPGSQPSQGHANDQGL